jgi:hypothetical protein
MRYSGSDFGNLASTEALVAGVSTIVVGELKSIEPGRKEFLGYGCDDPNRNETDEPCRGNPNGTLYASYANLVVHVQEVLKGRLDSPDEDLRIEQPWPNNVDLKELASFAPTGSRVLVLGDAVPDALEKAEPLDAAASVASNLLQIAAYGLVVKDSAGRAVGPLLDDGDFDSVVSSTDGDLKEFDSAVVTIAQAVGISK